MLQPACESNLAHILNNQFLTIMLSQIQLKRTSKQLQQHLKARLGNSRVVPTLAELIANKSIYIITSQSANHMSRKRGNTTALICSQTHAVPKQLHRN